MRYKIKLSQQPNGENKLTVYRGSSRYAETLTPEESKELAEKLLAFAVGPQIEPFYLLTKA